MTKEEILQEAKGLPYTDKLAMAQTLIQLARIELEQMMSQISPRMDNCEDREVTADAAASAEQAPLEMQKSELAFDEIVARLRKLGCKKEKTLLNSIVAMHQFRGGISEEDTRRVFQRMCAEHIISCNELGGIIWNAK